MYTLSSHVMHRTRTPRTCEFLGRYYAPSLPRISYSHTMLHHNIVQTYCIQHNTICCGDCHSHGKHSALLKWPSEVGMSNRPDGKLNNSPGMQFLQVAALPCTLSPSQVPARNGFVYGTITDVDASAIGGTITWGGGAQSTFTCFRGSCTVPPRTFAATGPMRPTVVLTDANGGPVGNQVTCNDVMVYPVSAILHNCSQTFHVVLSTYILLPVNVFLMSIILSWLK